jgi:hypothetical protein
MFIARIKKWNITALEVFADKVPDGAAEGGTAEKTADSVRIRPASRSSTSISRSKEEFARNIAAEVAKVFSGVRDNQLMMNLRSAVIRRLVAKGPRSTINELRRGPPDEAPLPLPLPPAEGD